MDRAEIEKQRDIGKQLMLVDIIHCENDSARKGAFSFVSKDELAKWASMEKEELGRLINTCADLDPFNMACNVAHECASYNEEYKKDKNAYSFMLHSFLRHGDDWDVINRMLRFDISQERFQELELHFAGKETA